MQRDMELIREIVRRVQAKDDLTPREIKIDGRDPAIVARHVELLHAAGMIDAAQVHRPHNRPPMIFVRDLSNAGHDFAAALQNDTVWSQVKQALSPTELAKAPLKIIATLGNKLLEAYVMSKVGLGN